MHDSPAARVGIVRPAHASPIAVVAEIEARVLHAELSRRVGPVVLDLRVDGFAVGPWQPLQHAAWPSGIDSQLGADRLWSGSPPLTALAGRTVEPAAAEVRGRMLGHLGLMPDHGFVLDARRLGSLLELHVRPTDLWLVARASTRVDTGDAAVDALVADPRDHTVAALDTELDALAALITPADASIANLVAELTAARSRVAQLESELRHSTVEYARRFDEVEHERAVLRELLERTELDQAATA